LIGLYVRLKLEETPVFQNAVDQGKKVKAPVTEVFKVAAKPMFIGTFVMVGCYTLFYLVTTWILSFGIGNPSQGLGLGIAYTDFLEIQLISIFAFIVGIPVSSILADKVGRKPILATVSALIIVFGFTFTQFLPIDSATEGSVLLFLTIGMFLMGLIFGPMSAVFPVLFPTNVRYTGSGISYNFSSILGAAIAPFIATWLVAEVGVHAVGIYLAIVSAISFIAVLSMKELSKPDLHGVSSLRVSLATRPQATQYTPDPVITRSGRSY